MNDFPYLNQILNCDCVPAMRMLPCDFIPLTTTSPLASLRKTGRWFVGPADVGVMGANSMVADRSGAVFAVLCPQVDFVIGYGSDPQGNITYMGTNVFGETTRPAGTNPVHGAFTGTFQ